MRNNTQHVLSEVDPKFERRIRRNRQIPPARCRYSIGEAGPNLMSLPAAPSPQEPPLPAKEHAEVYVEELRERRISALSQSNLPARVNEIPSLPETSNEEPTILEELAPAYEELFNNLPEKLAVSRSQIFSQVLSHFAADPNILSRELSFVIKGGRGTGVYREVLTVFWNEFYARYCMGENEVVPCIRHDFPADCWKCVALVFVKGFKDMRYIPVKLNKVFLQCIFSGEECLMEDILVRNFLNYIPQTDASVLRESIGLKEQNPVNQETILDILSSLDSKRVEYFGENLKLLLAELAHKEVIQKPSYIKELWEEIFKKELTPYEISLILDKTVPTVHDVLKLLNAEDSMIDDPIRETYSWLKRFVRSLDQLTLESFLRTVIGSDMVCVDKITVSCSNVTGLQQRFIGRTCGCVIEVPATYQSYVEYKAAFSAQLKSGFWNMDII